MNSAALLRRGIAPTPPLPASRLSLTFGHVSFHGGGESQRCKNGLQIIRCARTAKGAASSSGRGGAPLANTKMAMESLLCFSLDTAAEPETKHINDEKKKALQTLLEKNNPDGAMRIMTNLHGQYPKSTALKYEAALALVQVLIHIGTSQSLSAALGHLNEIERMAKTENLPSDARRPFYKAVIYTLLEESSNAQHFWNIYTRAISSGPRR